MSAYSIYKQSTRSGLIVKSFEESVKSLAPFQTVSMDTSSSTLTKVPDGYVMTSHSGHQIFIKETTKEII